MKLHEAIEKLLIQKGRSMTTSEIAKELNINKWYKKKDCSDITSSQINARVKKYSEIFNYISSIVSLIGNDNSLLSFPRVIKKKIKRTHINCSFDNLEIEKILMREEDFKLASGIDNIVPDKPGIYCICIIDYKQLPKPFDRYLRERESNIIYIGKASISLRKRALGQELRAKGHGTFFRSIGAVLGYRPIKGSLLTKKNKNNYKFSQEDETKIIEWINTNLKVNWVTFDIDIEGMEKELINKYTPLFNHSNNPFALKEVSKLREECKMIANS